MVYNPFQLPYFLTGDKDDPVKIQRNFEAISSFVNKMRAYENATGVSTNTLVNNVVANERLGAQVAGFKRGSVAYKQNGTEVAANIPRYETGKFSQAVMFEETSQNTLLQSDSFDNASWTKVGTSVVTANTTIAPDGTTTADTLTDDDAAANEYVYQNSSVAAANSETWTGSIYIKKDTDTTRFPELQISFSGGTAALYYVVQINTQTGATAVRAGYGTADNITVQSIGDYWRLCITGTNNATGNTVIRLVLHPALTTVFGGASEASAIGSCIVWRAQLEKKKYATSGIKTTTVAVTRAAETMVVPTSGNFTKSNWTVEFNYNPSIVGINRWLWICYIDVSNWYRIIATAAGQFQISVTSGGVEIGFSTALNPIITVGTNYSIMFSGNGSMIRACVNGVQIGADTAYVEPVGTLPTNMYVASDQSEANQANGLIDDLRISPIARTVAKHQEYYASGLPLPVDEFTGIKMNFDNTLRATTRAYVVPDQARNIIADNVLVPSIVGDGSDGDFYSIGNVTETVALDGGPVVKQYRSYTLNAGHTHTVSQRAKGLIILCQGDVTISGTLKMDNLAARVTRDIATPAWVGSCAKVSYFDYLSKCVVEMLLPAGGSGGAGGNSGNSGAGGSAGSNCAYGGSGGGGGGAGKSGAGGTGSVGGGLGGAGGGEYGTATAGGAGGIGGGGIIVIIAKGNITVNAGGVVTASSTGNGGNGGNSTSFTSAGGGGGGAGNGGIGSGPASVDLGSSVGGGGGGGAGGGVILFIYGTTYTNSGSVVVNASNGGTGGTGSGGDYNYNGYNGANGTVGSIYSVKAVTAYV